MTAVCHGIIMPRFEFANDLVQLIRFHHNSSAAFIVSQLNATFEAIFEINAKLVVGTGMSFFFTFINWNRAEIVLMIDS